MKAPGFGQLRNQSADTRDLCFLFFPSQLVNESLLGYLARDASSGGALENHMVK